MRDDPVDGTQPAESSAEYPDSLAGLAEGPRHEPSEAEQPAAAPRFGPDPDTVRSLLEEVFTPDSVLERSSGPGAGGAPDTRTETAADGDSAGAGAAEADDRDTPSRDSAGEGESEGAAESRDAESHDLRRSPDAVDASSAADGTVVHTAGTEGDPLAPVQRSDTEQRPGILPARRATWPTRRRLTRQAWRPRTRLSGRGSRAASGVLRRRTTRGSAGVIVAVGLLLLFCFVAVQFVLSLVNSLSGIGG